MTQPSASDRVQTLEGIEFAQHELSTLPTDISLDGFGFIANYTIVDGDLIMIIPCHHLPAANLSDIGDSANLVGYYEKDGLSARVAYNWRDQFLNFAGVSSGYDSTSRLT